MNKGAVALLEAARRKGFRLQKQIAEDVELDEPRISRLLSGKITPNRPEAVRLWDTYRIDPGLWDKEASDAEVASAERGLRHRDEPDAAKASTGTEG